MPTSSPIRVLWLARGLGPGGMERLLVHHARFADRDRFELHAAYLTERPSSVVSELEELEVTCTRLLGHGRTAWVTLPRRLRKLVRRLDIDVVHAHSPLPAALAWPVLRTMRDRPRLVYTEHNSWDCYGAATRAANALTYPLDDAQLAVSAAAKASAPGFSGRRVEVLTHGIDLDAVRERAERRGDLRAELGLDPGTVLVTTVANLRAEKAYDILLPAVARLVERVPEVVVLAVGHGQLRDEVEAEAKRLRLGDRFRLLGFREDAVELVSASDVFVLAARQEGLPVSLMEAAALGVPAVVTRVGGLPDVIEEGVTGRLVDPEDPAALADALAEVAADPALRRRLGDAAADGAARFDARRAVRRIEEVYEAVTG